MDNFFDVAYERDEAGKRHHYIAVRWDHRLQGQWFSYAVSGLASMRAYAVSDGGCFQPTIHVVNESWCKFVPQEHLPETLEETKSLKLTSDDRPLDS
jgi:hypothetical protein